MLVALTPAPSTPPISRYHPVLGWEKVPGAVQRIVRPEFSVELRFNSLGLRGPERPYAKPAGTRRVLLLGDSFTEGYYAEEPETVRARLESALARGCGPVEVINGGTIAYSTDQEYLFFREDGRRYAPDVVVLLFYSNDLYYNASPVGPGNEPKPFVERGDDGAPVVHNVPVPQGNEGQLSRVQGGKRKLKPWRGSIALRLLSNRTVDSAPELHAALARLGLVEPVSTDPPREFWPYGPGHGPEVKEMWDATDAILELLQRDVAAASARLGVLYIPVRFEVNDEVWELTKRRYRLGRRWDPFVVHDRLQEIAKRRAIPFVDPREALRAAEARSGGAYYTQDVHWNAEGNAVAARALEPFVRASLGCAEAR